MTLFGRSGLAAYALLTLAAASHFFTSEAPDPLGIWSHAAYGWWMALSFTAVQVAIGRAACRLTKLHLDDLDEGSRLLLYFAGGMCLSHIALLTLALLDLFSAAGVIAFILVALALAAPDLKHGALRLGQWRWSPALDARRARFRVIVVVLSLVWISPYLVQTLLPNSDWDAALHHLPMAHRFVDGRIGELDPAFAPWSYPGATHLVYALFLSVDAETAIIPFNFIAALATLLTCYLFANSISGKRAGMWAAIVLLSVNVVWELGLDARIDGFLALFFMIACYALVLWLNDRSRYAALVLAGAAAGMMLGSKYTGLLLAGVLVAPVLVTVLRGRVEGERSSARALVIACLLVVVPSAWWYARNFVELRDPIYDFLGGRMYLSVDESVLPYTDVHETLSRRSPPEDVLSKASYFPLFEAEPGESIVEPANQLNLLDVLVHPTRYARSKRGHTISLLLLLFLVLPLVNRSPPVLWCWAVGLGAFLIIGSMSNLMRYALPVWPLFAVGAGIVIAKLSSRIALVGVSTIAAGYLVANVFVEVAKIHEQGVMRYLGGGVSRIAWLEQAGYHNVNAMVPMIKLIRDLHAKGRMQASDVILMVGEGKGNLLPARYLPDYTKTGYRWLAEAARHGGDPEAIAKDLSERNIRYILFNYGYVSGNARVVSRLRKESMLTFYLLDDFIQRYARPIYDARGIMLLELVAPEDGKDT